MVMHTCNPSAEEAEVGVGVTGNSIYSMGYLVSTRSARAAEQGPAHQERKEKKGEIKMRGKQFAYNHQQLSDTV